MKQETIVTQTGKNPEKNCGSVNTPINRTSTILFPTLKAYHDAETGKAYYNEHKNLKAADYSYGITGTPTTYDLQTALAEIEQADHALVFPSGLSAITTILLSFLNSGDHVLIADSVYGPTRRFCNKELKRFGIETTYYDPSIGKDIDSLIQENTKIVYTESPGSLTFEIQDIPAISKSAKAKNKDIVVILDNSWATPLYFKPFDHGVDVSIHAGTKYFGGHSDLLIGSATFNDEHFHKIFRTYKDFGIHVSPDDCYLALRGIRTLATRVQQHEQTALKVAKWLSKRKEVKTILHPAFSSCPGHKIWKRDFTGSTGLFSIILNKQYSFEALSAMIDPMKIFGIGASWGGFESLILNFDPSTIRTASKWTSSGSCVRIYTGLEAYEDIINDLEQGFKRLKG